MMMQVDYSAVVASCREIWEDMNELDRLRFHQLEELDKKKQARVFQSLCINNSYDKSVPDPHRNTEVFKCGTLTIFWSF
jgi:hypothetical protein